MAKTSALSYKNIVSGALSLATTLFLVLVAVLAFTDGLAGLASQQFWTTFSVFFAVVTVFASFIEATIVPRLKKGGLMRTLFVYWALGTFLAAVLVILLILMSGSGDGVYFFVILGLYAWMLYVVNIGLARAIYPIVHKVIWKQSI